jgi:hypothetical protein
MEGISLESANIVFDKAVLKVIKDTVKHARLVSNAAYVAGGGTPHGRYVKISIAFR